jgi:uncharacterized protein (UPF0371 family)
MASTLKIEIEAESEDKIYPLLQHIFREITEGSNYKNPTNNGCVIDRDINNSWLVVNSEKLKGRYYWTRQH